MKNELLSYRAAIVSNKHSYFKAQDWKAYRAALVMLRTLDAQLVALGHRFE